MGQCLRSSRAKTKKKKLWPKLRPNVVYSNVVGGLVKLACFYRSAGMFIIIQAIIFLYVWPRKVKPKALVKTLSKFIQYFRF